MYVCTVNKKEVTQQREEAEASEKKRSTLPANHTPFVNDDFK